MSSIRWPSPSLPAFRQAATRRVRAWARKRQGQDALTAVLAARRTYILPTGVGLIYGLMAFAMLLGAMNYNNNLAFVLTFFLVALGFVAMHQCQRNLVGVDIAFAGVEPVFAGSVAEFRFAVTNPSRSARHRIRLHVDDRDSDMHDLGPGDSTVFTLPVDTAARGRVRLPRFGVHSQYPFELFRAWAWLHMDLAGLVYPRPADDAPPPPPSLLALGHRQHDARGEEDFAGLRRFVTGDSPRHVAWKAYARSGQLMSKRFAGADTSSQWFDFADLAGMDTETRLSILTRWVVDAHRTREDYGLRLPGEEIPPAHGAAHRDRCLEALALHGDGDG